MATPATLGTEFQINNHTAGNQDTPSVTALADGGFVVTWESYDQDDGGTDLGVYGQRYNADGTENGNEFQINTETANHQNNPSVTGLNDGGFVVTWVSLDQDDSFNNGVYGQRYDSAGAPVGGEFQINTYTAHNQSNPSVTALTDGGFVVTWDSYGQDAGIADNGVYGQRYDSAGVPVGGEFQINTHTADNQNTPSVTALTDGGFVVTWLSEGQDGDGEGIYGQRYDSAGVPVGGEFQINTHFTNNQDTPSVTALADGGFVVTWESYDQDDGINDWGVYGQRYNADGTTNGAEFQINTHTANNQNNPSVTALADGGFVVTWEAFDQDDGINDWGVYGRRYNADGTTNGDEFQINTHTENNQELPSVTALADGSFVVTWESWNQDGGGYGVYGQRYSVDLFTAGDDTVYLPSIGPDGGWQALAGDDRVIGGDSDDSVNGGAGNDYITGGDGADSISGGDGSDYLYGQGGDDTINAGAGAMDVSLGDDGNDTINGEGGMDYMYGYAGNDTANGGDGDDVAYGGDGNDELYGNDGADWLFGEAGDDKLFGGAGSDILIGGAGADEITGGTDNDWMWGSDMTGAGDGAADTFFFAANWGGDVIWDFEDGSDMLDLSGAGITSFADLSIGTFESFTTITSASGDIIYLRGAGDTAIDEASITAADFIFA